MNRQSQRTLPWRSERDFLAAIDSLPHGPDWKCVKHTIPGDIHQEDVEIWMRDPVDSIAELLGNPIFSSHLRFRPQRLFRHTENTSERMYGEAWLGDWWWSLQV